MITFRYKSGRAILSMLMLAYSVASLAQQESNHTAEIAAYGTALRNYCVTCHNDTVLTARLSLQQVDLANIGQDTKVWEKVLRKLKARAMPPSGVPRPEENVYISLVNYLESELDNLAMAYPIPGRPTSRRLNRDEYTNAVRDLFGIEFNFDQQFPADDTSLGFDNISDVLTLSPLLVERYISVAHKIQQQVLGDPDAGAAYEVYTLPQFLLQEDQMDEELPFASRGGLAIQHHFPVDGEYEIQVRFQRDSRDYIRGLVDRHRLDIRLDNERIKDFEIGGEKKGRSAFIFSTAATGDIEQEIYERTADEHLNVRFFARAGTRKVTVTFLKATAMPEQPGYSRMSVIDYSQYKGGVPGVRTVTIGGPLADAKISDEKASRKKIFICQPEGSQDVACAKTILSNLARLAYRRTPSEDEIGVLLDFFTRGAGKSSSFDEGIGMAINRMLAGPEFLFIVEQIPENTESGELYRISDLELATRLSLFLWNSIPDRTLIDIAESGRLSNPEILRQQVSRMLDDPRSIALVDSFGSQWLSLRKLDGVFPDGELFPYFDDNLKQAFRKETEYFLEYVLRNDRPLLELLNADYSFINERLARHYDIPGVYGNHFRKISLPAQTRGGLLSHGSVLTVTSYPNRTAPVIRGKWILDNMLGTPPPPPPPNVPGLQERNDAGKAMSMREAMEMHRANPVCASCHKVMDPLGFALENYDAIGKWRTIDAASGSPVDSNGALPDGTTFQGPRELQEVLLQKRHEDFIFTTIEKFLTYALGREILYTDAPFIRSIARQSAAEGYKLRSIITAITESTPFLMRRTNP